MITDLEQTILNLTKHKPKGHFVQIGAAYSTSDNEPCWHLLKRSWRGTFVEPNPRNCAGLMTTLIEQGYEDQYSLYMTAIADKMGVQKFYMPRLYDSCSSLEPQWLDRMAFLQGQDPGPIDTVYTTAITLNTLFDSVGTDFDLLCIDIEVTDEQLELIMNRVNWHRFNNLDVICLELISEHRLPDMLSPFGYRVMARYSDPNVTVLGRGYI